MDKYTTLLLLVKSLTIGEKKAITSLLATKNPVPSYLKLFQTLLKDATLSKQKIMATYVTPKAFYNDLDYLEKMIFKVLRWIHEEDADFDKQKHLQASTYFQNIEIARIKDLPIYLKKNIQHLKKHAVTHNLSFWTALAASYEFYMYGREQKKDMDLYKNTLQEIENATTSFVNARKLYTLSYELNNEMTIYQYTKNIDIEKYQSFLALPILQPNQVFTSFQEQNIYHSCRASIFLLLQDIEVVIQETETKLQLFQQPPYYASLAHLLAHHQCVSYMLLGNIEQETIFSYIQKLHQLPIVDSYGKAMQATLHTVLQMQYYLLYNAPEVIIHTLQPDFSSFMLSFQNNITISYAIALFRIGEYKKALKTVYNLETKDTKEIYYIYLLELVCYIELGFSEDVLVSKLKAIQRQIDKNYFYYDAFLPFIRFGKKIIQPNFPTKIHWTTLLKEIKNPTHTTTKLLYKEFGIENWIHTKGVVEK